MLKEYEDRLALSRTKLGRTSKTKNRINTGDHKPISQR